MVMLIGLFWMAALVGVGYYSYLVGFKHGMQKVVEIDEEFSRQYKVPTSPVTKVVKAASARVDVESALAVFDRPYITIDRGVS